MSASDEAPSENAPGMTRVIDRNIQALIAKREEAEERRGVQGRLADAVTRFTGSMRFVELAKHVAPEKVLEKIEQSDNSR